MQLVEAVAQGGEVAHVEYLRTYVEMQSDELDVLQSGSQVNDAVHVGHADAKLVLCQSGSNVGMGVGTNIGVDAESHVGHFATCGSQLVDDLELGHRLYVEAEDVAVQSEVNLPVSLAHACKNYLGGREAGTQGGLNLASAYTIGTQATLTDDGEHLGIGIGLNGIVHTEGIVVAPGLITNDGQSLPQQFYIVIIKGRLQLAEAVQGKCSFHKSLSLLYHSLAKSMSLSDCRAFFLSHSRMRKEML